MKNFIFIVLMGFSLSESALALTPCCSTGPCSDGSSCTMYTNDGPGSWCSCSCGYSGRPDQSIQAYCQGGGIANSPDGEVPEYQPEVFTMNPAEDVKIYIRSRKQ